MQQSDLLHNADQEITANKFILQVLIIMSMRNEGWKREI